MFCGSENAIEHQLSGITLASALSGEQNGSRFYPLQEEKEEMYEVTPGDVKDGYNSKIKRHGGHYDVVALEQLHLTYQDSICQLKADAESQLAILRKEFGSLKNELTKTQETTKALADQVDVLRVEKTARSESERVLTDKIVVMATSLQEVCSDKTQVEASLKFEVSQITQERDALRAKLNIVETSLKTEVSQITEERDALRDKLKRAENAQSKGGIMESIDDRQGRDRANLEKMHELEKQLASEKVKSFDLKKQLTREANNAVKWNGLVKELTIKLVDLSGALKEEGSPCDLPSPESRKCTVMGEKKSKEAPKTQQPKALEQNILSKPPKAAQEETKPYSVHRYPTGEKQVAVGTEYKEAMVDFKTASMAVNNMCEPSLTMTESSQGSTLTADERQNSTVIDDIPEPCLTVSEISHGSTSYVYNDQDDLAKKASRVESVVAENPSEWASDMYGLVTCGTSSSENQPHLRLIQSVKINNYVDEPAMELVYRSVGDGSSAEVIADQ